MITTTLSTKNQVTLPKFILEVLGIKSGDKLLVQIESDEIVVKPMGRSMVDSLVKSIKITKSKRGVPFEEALLLTKKIVAKKLASQ
ncbi:AbrB/MazE/SpoVT family DNA-binding domain-containing protein [Candidatus Parcubacteria bacterium]|nr:AbrB/MazE/SpoVT family DNA-binding domain-containing protein [Candidatus Parcubacteria bacterium]